MAREIRAAWPVLALAVLLGACAAPVSEPRLAESGLQWIAGPADGPSPTRLIARVCRPPPGASAAPVAVINHGAPPQGGAAAMLPGRCDSEPAQWFLARGYLVVFPLRRGFGASTGPIVESSGACDRPDYVHAGRESARDVAAAVRFATRLPGARPDGAVVLGQSTGGWAVMAYASLPHPPAALVSMAGGRGGHALGEPDSYCRPDLLVAAAGVLGATAQGPMLWVNAQNDTYFDPGLAASMRDAFNAAGGHATLVEPPPFDGEGHLLFNGAGGSAVWGPILARYLVGTIDVAERDDGL